MSKPRILVVSDSPTLHTGFGIVSRHICDHLYATGNYDVKAIGWYHRPTDEIVPYDIIPTKNTPHEMAEKDRYSAVTFKEAATSYKPDLVLTIGDPWMIDHVPPLKRQMGFKLLSYIPIDGIPWSRKWVGMFKDSDIVVAYCPFGRTAMIQAGMSPDKIVTIGHGVDAQVFKPMSKEEKSAIRKNFHATDETFIVGCVARNQPRKNLPSMFKAMNLFIMPYAVCDGCGELMFGRADACPACGGKSVTKGAGKDNVKLYLHAAPNDCGWDLAELAERFNLEGRVVMPKGIEIGRGVDTTTLAKIVNIFDVFTLPTGGEGWGLPILEAMSCGLPCLVTDYSGHVDFCTGAAELIAVSEFITEPMSNVERAFVDLLDYCMRLDKMYYDDPSVFRKKWGKYIKATYPDTDMESGIFLTGTEARKKLGSLARERALVYDWPKMCEEWVLLINKILGHMPSSSVDEVRIPDAKIEVV